MKKIPEKEYKKIISKVPVPCVDALIHIGPKFLLFKRNEEPIKDQWFTSGGRVMFGETLEKAVLRRVKEETGIKIRIEKMIGVYQTMFKKNAFENRKYHTINVAFLARPASKKFKIKLDKTHRDFMITGKISKNFHWYLKSMIRDSGILKK